MDILGLLTGPVGTVLKIIGIPVLVGVGGIGGFFYSSINKKALSVEEAAVSSVSKLSNYTDDPDMKAIIVHCIHMAAKMMPDASGNEKLQYALKKVKAMVPDWLISDEDLEKIINQSYVKFQADLKSLPVPGSDQN